MASLTKIPDDLSEQARKRLGMYFVKEYETEPNKLVALTLEPTLEQSLIGRVKKSQFDIGLAMDPSTTQGMMQELEPKVSEMISQGMTPILLTTAELRLALRRFFEPSLPQLVILSYQELPTETQIEPFGAIALKSQGIPQEILENVPDNENSLGVPEPVSI